MEVKVTKNKKEQVKAWVNEHKTMLIAGGVAVVTTCIAKKCIDDLICLDPAKFENGRKGVEKFADCLNEISKGATRWDACIGGNKVTKISDLGAIGIEAVEVAGLKPETEVTGLMIFTK